MDDAIDFQAVPQVAAGRARGGRATQQDDLACLHDAAEQAYLLVLADGMGGEGAGELASAGVIDVARRLWETRGWRTQPGPLFLEALCQEAHAELRRRGERVARGSPHSTVVALLVRGRQVAWAHVGDSRLYRFRGTRLLGRTEDHSLAARRGAGKDDAPRAAPPAPPTLLRGRGRRGAGAPGGARRLYRLRAPRRRGPTEPPRPAARRGAGKDDAALAADPDQHKLLRGLGGTDAPVVEHGCGVLGAGERFVLCSDGVWAQLSTAELGRLSARPDQEAALRDALRLALTRGGRDGDNAALIFARPGPQGWPARWTHVVGSAVRKAAALGRRRARAGAAG